MSANNKDRYHYDMNPFIAIKFDIVNSRKIKNRFQVQEKLFSAVASVNSAFADAIRSGFVVTHGDEVQGLLDAQKSKEVIGIIERFIDALRPDGLRFGVGVGTLATRLQPYAIGMDGKVWHRAKTAIEFARNKHTPIQFDGFGETNDRLINALANMLLLIRLRWTREQLDVVKLLETNKTQVVIAKQFGVSEAAISKRLSAAGWRYYRDGRAALGLLLEESIKKQLLPSEWD
ncbi:MAG: SatD family protein [Firmicutes bacterium]|nr:SatD family protein [Bacillota bacterium]